MSKLFSPNGVCSGRTDDGHYDPEPHRYQNSTEYPLDFVGIYPAFAFYHMLILWPEARVMDITKDSMPCRLYPAACLHKSSWHREVFILPVVFIFIFFLLPFSLLHHKFADQLLLF